MEKAKADHRLQVLHPEVLLVRQGKEVQSPEAVANELERRLSVLPYVVEASWSPSVIKEDGSYYLRGMVKMLSMAELPEESPDLKSYYECFDMPGIVGPDGRRPSTVGEQTEQIVNELDRIDQEKQIRRVLQDEEERKRVVGDDLLTSSEIEVSVALNMLMEDLDRAALEKQKEGDHEAVDLKGFNEGYSAGLRWAHTMVLNEVTERRLPFVAAGAPWEEGLEDLDQ